MAPNHGDPGSEHLHLLKLNENNGEFYPDVELVTLRNGFVETKKSCQLMER